MLFTKIENEITSFRTENISDKRKTVLEELIDFIQEKMDSRQIIKLNFICTHNSRRSHLAQVWAQTLACYYKVEHVYCYSGGTEATALFPVIAKTLESQGFEVEMSSEDKNPIYNISFSRNENPIKGFSKTYDDDFNPKSEFAAILTCSEADEGCPFISGAEKRIPIMYKDPKISDNTTEQQLVYNQRSRQIATEMNYVFSNIKSSK
jgi:arsenate reductase